MSEHEITQMQLARRAGYASVSTVNRWLTGARRPSLRTMLVVDEALDELVRLDPAQRSHSISELD